MMTKHENLEDLTFDNDALNILFKELTVELTEIGVPPLLWISVLVTWTAGLAATFEQIGLAGPAFRGGLCALLRTEIQRMRDSGETIPELFRALGIGRGGLDG